jgi:cell division protein FtsQ
MGAAIGLAAAWVAYDFGHFLMASPEMALVHPEQVQLAGNHYVPRANVLEIFAADRGKSVLRIPLEGRRRQLEAIPWVERATVRRALPNRIEVEIVERIPVAFVRQGDAMDLVDAHGVILDRPLEGEFHFPVVTGISAGMPLEDRGQRMQLFSDFTQEIELAHPGAIEQVSVVDLSDPHDVRATLTGLGGGESVHGAATGTWGQADAPMLVHFGDRDFAGKYRTLVDNIGQWRATAGAVESVDLRFSQEAVVNPDASAAKGQRPPKASAALETRHSR